MKLHFGSYALPVNILDCRRRDQRSSVCIGFSLSPTRSCLQVILPRPQSGRRIFVNLWCRRHQLCPQNHRLPSIGSHMSHMQTGAQNVANRARQDKHQRADHSHSSHSVVSFDYGFASRLEDEHKITILCAHDRDTGLIHAIPSLTKGGTHFNYLRTELTRFIVMTQHREIALRCDGEPSRL